jgi:hypothetical protein
VVVELERWLLARQSLCSVEECSHLVAEVLLVAELCPDVEHWHLDRHSSVVVSERCWVCSLALAVAAVDLKKQEGKKELVT